MRREAAALRADLALAARILSPAWPLRNFIAVNPLGGLEELRFERAVGLAGEALGARGTLAEELYREAARSGRTERRDLLAALEARLPGLGGVAPVRVGGRPVEAAELLLADLMEGPVPAPPRRAHRTIAERQQPQVARRVDAETGKWCAAFLDDHAGWPMPGRELGFYPAWRRLARRDPLLARPVRAELAGLPESSEDAALDALGRLGVGAAERLLYLQAHLACLPGWASHVRWQGERGDGIDLLAYVAMRLSLEAALLGAEPARSAAPAGAEAPAAGSDPLLRARAAGASGEEADAVAAVLALLPEDERGFVWLDAYEAPYRRRLLSSLRTPAAPGAERPAAQLVCCIDVRSEGLRRHFEAAGPYETLGFAGFFALAIRFRDLAGGAASDLCPVLIAPQSEAAEVPVPGSEREAERRLAGTQALRGAEDGFARAKQQPLSPFALAEAGGWVAGPLAAARTFAPAGLARVTDSLRRLAEPESPTAVALGDSLQLGERVALAEAALRMMGLVEGFGRLVILCGHGSRTENNPYETALACGACGGSSGGPNARAAAALFNDPAVRRGLLEAGIEIPDDTWFLAAEHETTADAVTLLDLHLAPVGHREDIARVGADLDRAGARNSAERARSLPGAGTGSAAGRGRDWAQVFPEWGLAGNAAFLVGPRELSRGLDLGRRVFLHSYRAEADPDGSGLETILTAPLIVAQWINCQYYFSTVDPIVFGAGTKTIHNVVAGIGVLAGPAGDLQLGLPWQSVADGERLVHEPMRLLAVVQAPLERIDAIVERHSGLGDLLAGGWIRLAARPGAGEGWRVRGRDGSWIKENDRMEEA